jgi:hypothetical protein
MAFDYNDPETKAAVDKMVTEAVEKATTGLANKNSELLGEVKKFKEFKGTAEELQAKLSEIEQASLEEQGKYKELLEQKSGEYANKLDDLQKMLDQKQKSIESLLIGDGLKAALIEVGVKKEFLPYVESFMRGEVTVKESEGQLSAVANDKPLSEYVKEWAASDEGKAFVIAPTSSGGGAPGGTTNTNGKTLKEMTEAEMIALKTSDPAAFNALVNKG